MRGAVVIFVLIQLLSVRASEIQDLGVVSTETVLALEKCKRRQDFKMFKIEVLPQNLRGETNKVLILTTNSSLKLDDFAMVPQGPAIMGVRSICQDDTASPVSLFKIDIQREAPSPTRVRKLRRMLPLDHQKIEHVIEAITPKHDELPPMPPMPATEAAPTNSVRQAFAPLPGGTNDSYAQYQWRLEQAALHGRRRSQ